MRGIFQHSVVAIVLAMVFSLLPISAETLKMPIGFLETEASSQRNDEAANYHAGDDIVRVSIVLDGDATISHYSTKGVAQNASAVRYRGQLRQQQEALTERISSQIIGAPLDVNWNITLAGNMISANVKRSQIEAIKGMDGVKDVVLERRYNAPEPMEDEQGVTEPEMITSGVMVGANVAWANGYTGASSKVAVIDTGTRFTHQSFDASGYAHAIAEIAQQKGMTYDEYVKQSGVLTLDGVKDVFEQLNVYDRIEQEALGYTADDMYLNAKIPFAFNYVDNDLEVDHAHDRQGDHGTHVSGISTANRYIANGDGTYSVAVDKTRVVGNAPDAQLFTMKVFGKNGGAWDSDFIIAIEDAIILGADACNLSLGSAEEGFATEIAYPYQEILDRLVESDTVVAIAAGNEYNFAYRDSNRRMLYADDVSYDHVGSPSSYDNALSVASASNAGSASYLFTIKDNAFTYTEPSGGQDQIVTLGGEQSYVLIDGFGSQEEMAALADVIKGKIAMVSRGGDISFYQKANAAVEKGAIATVIYNNQPGTLNMSLSGYSYKNPVIGIAQGDAAKIKELSDHKMTDDGAEYYEGKVTIGTELEIVMPDLARDVSMSAFSSFGVPGSLTLKPEITAPGGNIYSTRGNSDSYYGSMSGTSMATPQVAGLAALAAQYIREKGLAQQEGLTVRALAQSLLMSTAGPVFETDENYYSVMKQGAGLANVGRVVTAKGYILMDPDATTGAQDGKVKAEFYDDPERIGEYSYRFTFNNMTDETLEYTLATDMFTQSVGSYEATRYAYQAGDYLETTTTPIEADISYEIDGHAFVPTVEITADVDLDGDTDADDAKAILMIADGNKTIADYGWIDEEAISATEKFVGAIDLNGDGEVNTYDAHLIISSIEAEGFTVEGHGSVEIEVSIKLSDETKASFDEKTPNGAYVEGYTFIRPMTSGEGEILDVEYSIPMLGFYGNWSDASMYDRSSYVEFLYNGANYENSFEKLPYTISYLKRNSIPYYANVLKIDDAWYQINPYATEGEIPYGKAAVRSNAVINGYYGRLIRNAGLSAAIVADENDEIVYVGDVDPQTWRVFYYSGMEYQGRSTAAWWDEDDVTEEVYLYGHNGNDVEKTAAELGFGEGDVFSVKALNIPEYYTRNDSGFDERYVRDLIDSDKLGKGVWLSTTLTVDDTQPQAVAVSKVKTHNAMDGTEKQEIVVETTDNQFVAYVALLVNDEVIAHDVPSAQGAGETTTSRFDVTNLTDGTYKVFVGDYAGNEAAYELKFNDSQSDANVALEETEIASLSNVSLEEPEAIELAARGSLNSSEIETDVDEETNGTRIDLWTGDDTNGIFVIAYDTSILALDTVSTIDSYGDLKVEDGLITVAFAHREELNDYFVHVEFSYTPSDKDVETIVKITALEENDKKPGSTEEIKLVLPGNKYPVTVAAGEHGKTEPQGTFEAMAGEQVKVVAIPDTHYVVDTASVNDETVAVEDNAFSFVVEGETKADVTFKLTEYTVKALAEEGGVISPEGETAYVALSEATYMITPDEYHEIDSVTLNGDVLEVNDGIVSFTVDANKELKATFKPKDFIVTATVGEGGTISPAGKTSYAALSEATYKITPGEHYEIKTVTLNGEEIEAKDGVVSFTVDANKDLNVTFGRIVRTVIAKAGKNGSISPSGEMMIESGDEIEFTLEPADGYEVEEVLVNGRSVEVVDNKFTLEVASDISVKAFFTNIERPVEPEKASVLLVKEGVGEATLSAQGLVDIGTIVTLQYSEDIAQGYVLDYIKINGKNVEALDGTMAFTVEGDTVVNVVFRQLHIEFYDEHWYENGIIQGTYDDPKGVKDTQFNKTVRGREIFDPATDKWYWLDSVLGGKPAKGKEVWMPYVYQDEKPGSTDGKWVRYDANGGMIKGWYTASNGKYYYDLITGAMAKGTVVIDGKKYTFDLVTGILQD